MKTFTTLDLKIIETIRSYMPDIWGLKTNDFIKSYCEFFPLIEEAVCNRGLDIDSINIDELKLIE